MESIQRYTPEGFDVVIVDNRSSTYVKDALERLQKTYRFLSVIHHDSVAGFSHAVNRGFDTVRDNDDLVVIMNNDTVVTPLWLDAIQETFSSIENVGMVVPRQVLPANHKIAPAHVRGINPSLECDINLSAHHRNVLGGLDLRSPYIELTYAPLFCSAVTSDVLRKVGPLDAGNGPHFRSDWVFCDSLRNETGQRILYTPYSKVYHFQGISTLATSEKVRTH